MNSEKKKGRPRKDDNNTEKKTTKKRGRKPEIAYFKSSAAKRAMKEITDTPSINNCSILQLNVDTESKQSDEPDYTPLLSSMDINFKLLQIEQNKESDVVEEFLDLKQNNQEPSLEQLYTEKIETRKIQNQELLNKIQNYHLHTQDFQKDNMFQKNIPQEQLNSTTIDDLSKIQLMKEITHEWNETSNIRCWWCCHNFDTIPLGLPIRYKDKLDKFIIKGIFCSIPCVYAYGKQHMNFTIIKPLICHMYSKLTKNSKIDFKPALPKETLKDFGGELTIEEFRQFSTSKRIYKRVEYPLIIQNDTIYLSDIDKIKDINKKINQGKDKKLKVHDSNPTEKLTQKDSIDCILGLEYED